MCVWVNMEMSFSMKEIYEAAWGVVVGLLSGVYAGLVVARYQRFADLRLQAKRLVLQAEYIWEGNKMFFLKKIDMSEFDIISSDFYFLNHRDSGDKMLSLISQITSSVFDAENGIIGFTEFDKKYLSWQKDIRSLKPNYWQLIKLWGGL